MPDRVASFGFDPGLRHGALIHAEFWFSTQRHVLTKFEVCHEWREMRKKKSNVDDRLSKDSTPLEISAFVNSKFLPHFSRPAVSAGIEYDPNSVYWRAYKAQVVATAFMLGYLARGLQAQGLAQVYIKPHQLKAAFGISPKEKKEYVGKPIQLQGCPPLEYKPELKMVLSELSEDVFDALLIAYFTAAASHRSQHGN